jgi:hypothetical protein
MGVNFIEFISGWMREKRAVANLEMFGTISEICFETKGNRKKSRTLQNPFNVFYYTALRMLQN